MLLYTVNKNRSTPSLLCAATLLHCHRFLRDGTPIYSKAKLTLHLSHSQANFWNRPGNEANFACDIPAYR